jgi:hypothetical protein
MRVIAKIEPINIEPTREEPFYDLLYCKMQMLGLLTSFTEKMNWDTYITDINMGDVSTHKKLQKVAAKSEGMFLWYAKWKKETVFQHLTQFSIQNTYLLPVRFEKPFFISYKGNVILFISANRLLEECSWLEMYLNERYKASDVVNYWKNLKLACIESKESVTPIKILMSK